LATDKVHIRHYILYKFQEENTAKVCDSICFFFFEGISYNIFTCTCIYWYTFWFKRFKSDDFSL